MATRNDSAKVKKEGGQVRHVSTLSKVLQAIDEVIQMDNLQLIEARRHFNWRNLRDARLILANFIEKGE